MAIIVLTLDHHRGNPIGTELRVIPTGVDTTLQLLFDGSLDTIEVALSKDELNLVLEESLRLNDDPTPCETKCCRGCGKYASCCDDDSATVRCNTDINAICCPECKESCCQPLDEDTGQAEPLPSSDTPTTSRVRGPGDYKPTATEKRDAERRDELAELTRISI